MPSEVKFLTIEQVAEMFQVTKATIYKLQKMGLPFIKLGKNVRYDRDDVINWAKNKNSRPAENSGG